MVLIIIFFLFKLCLSKKEKMISNETKIRVRYGETDQMGYVYYGNYAQFFEVGRVEWLRGMGVSYKSLEESGIMLPVTELRINYAKPARYDDELTVITTLKNKPLVKIEFDFEIKNQKQELITTGYTSLVFIDMKRNRPVKGPEYLLNRIHAEFS